MIMKKFGDIKENIRSFIKKLKVSKSHYGGESRGRVSYTYLPSYLRIKKLVKVYTVHVDEKLKVCFSSLDF